MRYMLIIWGVLSSLSALAQVVSLNPPFVTQNDTVEIIYDATQGNGALVGVNPIYAHTGVITNLSSSPTDWRHVQGNWGTADAQVLMTNVGNNKYRIKYHINSFYGVPANETVTHLAFVFRNQNGSLVGRDANGGDIFVPLSQGGFQARFSTPTTFGIYHLNDTLDVSAQASDTADISIFLNGVLLSQNPAAIALNERIALQNYGPGSFELLLQAVKGGVFSYDTLNYVVRSGPNIGVDPYNAEEGITIISPTQVVLKLRAPFKDYVYVIGDFNDWQITPSHEMFRTPDGQFYWLSMDSLQAGMEYAFQYYVGEEGLRIADPYAEKILDPWNDPYISAAVYPNLKPYPHQKTDQVVGIFNTQEATYTWQNPNFQKPAVEDLMVYELLIRDFDARHTYQSVIDRLPHLQALGINAIELMPVMEFEGNESWGYNPMFFMAPDKYYGTKNDLKALIDSCHGRGIAVIMDIALNHAFGQSPMVRMYFDPTAGPYGQPTAQNPWFNQVPKHEFNVGYDFNHESDATKYFARRVFQHWINEYKIDGYRIDLSKGFTQKNTLGNANAMAQYDQGRINILSRLKNNIEEADSNAIVILEHFAENSEEKELASRGFVLWGNANHQYNEAAMGYSSNLSGLLPQSRGFGKDYLIGYMESHDEERLMYKALNFGNSNGSYNIKDEEIALERMGLAASFFFTLPGPKMLWQFGEMGYDYSINRCTDGTIDPACRLSNKPIRWDYIFDPQRLALMRVYSELMWLRRNHAALINTTHLSSFSLNSAVKNLVYFNGDSGLVAGGNFDVKSANLSLSFPAAGWWYDFFTGDSLYIQSSLDTVLAAGEYHIWTNFRPAPAQNNGLEVEEKVKALEVSVYPNPVQDKLHYFWSPLNAGRYEILDLQGKQVGRGRLQSDRGEIDCRHLPAGLYFLQFSNGHQQTIHRMIKN